MTELKDELFYKPSEIVSNGWITDTQRNPNYWYVLKLIKKGILSAINKGTGAIAYYMVSGKEIRRYKKEVEGIEI